MILFKVNVVVPKGLIFTYPEQCIVLYDLISSSNNDCSDMKLFLHYSTTIL